MWVWVIVKMGLPKRETVEVEVVRLVLTGVGVGVVGGFGVWGFLRECGWVWGLAFYFASRFALLSILLSFFIFFLFLGGMLVSFW